MFRLTHRLPILILLPAVMALGACEMLQQFSSPSPQPAPVTVPPPAPEPAPARITAPVPVRKPAVPAVATPAPPPAPEPELPVPGVIGLNRMGLMQTYGLPVAEREAPPARIMEFGIGDCRLAAYLYFDTARNDFYALQYEVNGMPAPNASADRCLTRISRDANRR